MTSISSIKLNNTSMLEEKIQQSEKEQNCTSYTEISSSSRGTAIAFPNLTRFGGSSKVPTLVMIVEDDVNAIVDKIDQAMNEEEQISSILKANTFATTFDLQEINLFSKSSNSTAKTIGFVEYTGNSHTINAKTNTTALMNCFTPDTSAANVDIQTKVFKSAVTTMTNWLDDYINNYDKRVAEGTANGEIEAKLSFLLRIRKAIENCSFPVGFAPQSGTAMGSYNWSYYVGEFLNPENEAFTNRGAEHDLNPKMLLRTDMFASDRKFKTEAEAMAAVDNASAGGAIDFSVEDLIFANEDAYYQFKGVQLATVLIHEFVHSTHISNEAVTYFTCELMESDYYNESVYGNFSSKYLTKAQQLSINGSALDLTSIKYADMTTKIDTGNGIIAAAFGHSLRSIDKIAQHGHEMNKGDLYTEMSKGNTTQACKKELLNFVYNA